MPSRTEKIKQESNKENEEQNVDFSYLLLILDMFWTENTLWNYPEPQLVKHISLMTIHCMFSILMLDVNWQKVLFVCLLKSILFPRAQHTIFYHEFK